jgi:hypothetical protein
MPALVMPHCPGCSRGVPEGATSCPACGARLTDHTTQLSPERPTVRRTIAVLLASAEASIFLSVSMCFLVFGLWVVFRLRILADAVVVLLYTVVGASEGSTVGIAIGALTP